MSGGAGRGAGGARGTQVLRRWDWAVPSTPVHREVLSVLPEGGDGGPDGSEPPARPPLLFVHGIGHGAWCFAENWLPAAARRGFAAHALSLRGHGGSGGARRLGRSLLRDYVHDVMQTVVELPSPPVLVGHSMGAVVVQRVLERYPAAAGVLLTPSPVTGALGTLVSLGRRRPLDVAAATVGRTLPMRAEALFVGLDPATGRRYADRTGRESPLVQYELLLPRAPRPVRCPVLVVGTPDDGYVRVADVERTAAALGVDPVWLPGIGHDLMLDAGWERALDVVLDWVDEAVPAGVPAAPPPAGQVPVVVLAASGGRGGGAAVAGGAGVGADGAGVGADGAGVGTGSVADGAVAGGAGAGAGAGAQAGGAGAGGAVAVAAERVDAGQPSAAGEAEPPASADLLGPAEPPQRHDLPEAAPVEAVAASLEPGAEGVAPVALEELPVVVTPAPDAVASPPEGQPAEQAAPAGAAAAGGAAPARRTAAKPARKRTPRPPQPPGGSRRKT